MTIRKTVTLVEEINSEYGAPASPPLRRIAIAAVFENPLACACRKSNPDVLVMQTAQNGAGNDAATFRDSACDRRVLVQG